MAVFSEVAKGVLDLAWSRPPTLGEGRLICVDGPAGSGKTSLAETIARMAPAPSFVVHMDDLYEGWDGLPEVAGQLESLLLPHAAGWPGKFRRYDWHLGRFAKTVIVPPGDLLVIDGVGSGSRRVAELVTVLVWVEAPHDVRMQRAIERDGDAFAPHWAAWARAEEEHFASEGTRERADLIVGTS